MWYPEESISFCRHCDLDIPVDCFWRGRGYSISGHGKQARITVLYSQCPQCGQRMTEGLEGPWWYRLLYGWLWKLRYPNVRPPRNSAPGRPEPRRRAPSE